MGAMSFRMTELSRVLQDEFDSAEQFGTCGPRLFAAITQYYDGKANFLPPALREELNMNGLSETAISELEKNLPGFVSRLMADLLLRVSAKHGGGMLTRYPLPEQP
jgi:hypothetical protein